MDTKHTHTPGVRRAAQRIYARLDDLQFWSLKRPGALGEIEQIIEAETAAPDLLEALEELVRTSTHFRVKSGMEPRKVAWEVAVDQARAAIAKARGKA